MNDITTAAHYLKLASEALERANAEVTTENLLVPAAAVFTQLARKQLANTGQIQPITDEERPTL